jgi:hypothetical protein
MDQIPAAMSLCGTLVAPAHLLYRTVHTKSWPVSIIWISTDGVPVLRTDLTPSYIHMLHEPR